MPSLITIVSGRGPLDVVEVSLNLCMCSDAEFIAIVGGSTMSQGFWLLWWGNKWGVRQAG